MSIKIKKYLSAIEDEIEYQKLRKQYPNVDEIFLRRNIERRRKICEIHVQLQNIELFDNEREKLKRDLSVLKNNKPQYRYKGLRKVLAPVLKVTKNNISNLMRCYFF